MASGVHKYSAYEAAAFILASDSESNDTFGDWSILESSNSYDSEEETCFPGMEIGEKLENDRQICFNTYFCFFLVQVNLFMIALYSEWNKLWVAIKVQFWNTLTLYYFLTILAFSFYFTVGKQ